MYLDSHSPLVPHWAQLGFACGYSLLLLSKMWLAWNQVRNINESAAFHFYILDALAGTLALFPTMIAIKIVTTLPEREIAGGCIVVTMMALSQLAGTFIGRVRATRRPESEWSDAGWVFVGGQIALLKLGVSYVVFAAMFFLLSIVYWTLWGLHYLTGGVGTVLLGLMAWYLIYFYRLYF